MGLIACPECGQTISSTAATCIHCGAGMDATAERIDYVTGERIGFVPRPAVQLAARPTRYPSTAGFWLMVGGSVAVILGSFLPWITRADAQISGLAGKGPITLAVGIAMVLLALSARAAESKVPRLLVLTGGAVAILVALVDSSRLMETGFHRELMGPGLSIVLLGAAIAIAGSLMLEK